MKKIKVVFFVMFFFMFSTNVLAQNLTHRALILDQGTNVRKGPGTNNERMFSLSQYSIYNLVENKIYKDTNNNTDCSKDWYQIYYNGVSTGYVCADHVEVVTSHSIDGIEPISDCEKQLNEKGFPSTYWGGLCKLKEKYPAWQFEALKTNLEWKEVIDAESSCGINFIYNQTNFNNEIIDNTCTVTSPGGYYPLLPKGVAYYMDPRNFLSDRYIFQFQGLKYDEPLKDTYVPGVNSIIGNSLFYNYHISIGNDLGIKIHDISKEMNINPIFTASRIIQELGNKDSLYNLYSGVYEGYEKAYYGYYNFMNFGVSDTCVKNYGTTYCGLNYAKKNEWNSVDAAIKGGMSQISNYYVNAGQYTGYLQKFNVVPVNESKRYTHQYMTNIAAPSSEAGTSYSTYKNLNVLNSNFVFYIPIYNNMGATISNSGSGAVETPDEETPETIIPISTIVTSSGYKYTSTYISNIEPGTDVNVVKSAIEAVSGTKTVSITDKNNAVITTGVIGTGAKVTINNNKNVETLTVVVKGDTSGDGIINALDLLQVQKYILGTYTLESAYKEAGDTSGDGEINALDLLQVQKSILGSFKIVQ